jgi:poly(3-hydroxybutyrate) depolymerase
MVSATGGAPGTGGKSTQPVGTGGQVGSGGAGSGGQVVSGGAVGTGGAASDGGRTGRPDASVGGADSGPGGTSGAGGTAAGGSTGGGTGVPGNYPLGNDPVKSAGCGTDGKATLLTGGSSVAKGLATSTRLKITSNGSSREYIIDIPADYDKNKAYRLFYTSHWIGSTDTAVATGEVSTGGAENWGFYGLHRMAMAAKDPAIFAAPQSVGSTWQETDNTHLFADILKAISDNLCIDTSRVFATGFSFGGMITYSLSTNHQKTIRAAVGIAPANYNIYLPNPIPRDPIAWMSTTGMGDTTCPYDGGGGRGAKYIAQDRAKDNGCTVPSSIPTWTSSSPARHVCYDFEGCKSNYPLKVCTFNGNHQAAPVDSGGGDNGLTSWIPTESWKFFTQF